MAFRTLVIAVGALFTHSRRCTLCSEDARQLNHWVKHGFLTPCTVSTLKSAAAHPSADTRKRAWDVVAAYIETSDGLAPRAQLFHQMDDLLRDMARETTHADFVKPLIFAMLQDMRDIHLPKSISVIAGTPSAEMVIAMGNVVRICTAFNTPALEIGTPLTSIFDAWLTALSRLLVSTDMCAIMYRSGETCPRDVIRMAAMTPTHEIGDAFAPLIAHLLAHQHVNPHAHIQLIAIILRGLVNHTPELARSLVNVVVNHCSSVSDVSPSHLALCMSLVDAQRARALGQALVRLKVPRDSEIAAAFEPHATTPEAAALLRKLQPRLCANCGEAAGKKCNRCKHERYCGSECQAAAWPEHKLACSEASM